MKEIFDVNRFGKYFAYDVRSAVSTFGLPMLILGLWPFIWLIFSYLLSFIFGQDISSDQTSRIWPYVTMVIVGLTFGARVYGGVTDRRKGPDWIALPASALEKTLSLLLVTCVVAPAALLALTAVSNALVSLSVPYFGEILPFKTLGSLISERTDGNYFNIPLILWLNWCENILFFTLGALCFKRNKVGKSILCYIGLALLIGIEIYVTGQKYYCGSFQNAMGLFQQLKYRPVVSVITVSGVSSTYSIRSQLISTIPPPSLVNSIMIFLLAG